MISLIHINYFDLPYKEGGAIRNININNLAINSKKKGIDIVGTGDCLHPIWLNELKKELIEDSTGFFYSQHVQNVNFILQTVIETIWKHNKNVKKVHFIL